MNIYLIGMIISLVVYVLIGFVISRTVKNAEDYYVAGRRAPVFLISGSMIASYCSTGLFMGDAGQAYIGAFVPLIIVTTMQVGGYLFGAVFFGRYLRRSKALTIPEFFGRRFNSGAIRILATITAIVTMTVYLLSVIQGIGTLMTAVTGLDYKWCLIIAMVVFTTVTVVGGSSGVLITDTLMATIFTIALLIAVFSISNNTGGWFDSIASLASNPATTNFLSWAGEPGSLFESGGMNMIWAFVNGIVWFSVCMVGPWQSSRYLMAKNEHTVVRSSFISALGIFLLEILVGLVAVMINIVNPDIVAQTGSASNVMIWAAMNIMPKILGVILLTGVLAAGISSATTFLSLIGSSFANDILKKEGKSAINVGRITMIVVSLIVLGIALLNSPSIYWVMIFGGSLVGSTWMPVALASVLSKRITKKGAFWGMLAGFIACVAIKFFSTFSGISLPAYLDPSLIGMVCNVIAMVIADRFSRVTEEEILFRQKMFIVPDEEKDPVEVRKTLRATKWSFLIGVFAIIFMLVLWVIPYLRAKI